MTSDADLIEIMNKKFAVEMLQGTRRFYSPLLWLNVQFKGFHDRMWRLTLMTSWQKTPVILHSWTPQRRVHRQSRPTRGLSTGSSLMNFDKQYEHTTQRKSRRLVRLLVTISQNSRVCYVYWDLLSWKGCSRILQSQHKFQLKVLHPMAKSASSYIPVVIVE